MSNSMRKVLLVSKEQKITYLEHEKQFARRERWLSAKEMMEALSVRPFYTLIVNATNAEKNMPKHMVSVQSYNTPFTIVDPGVACQ